MRVAYTLEQCWHEVPGGTAVAALELCRALDERDDVELVGVAGRHRTAPADDFVPPIPVHRLPIARPWLYETWNRFGRPRVERATGAIDVCHSTLAIPAASAAPQVVTVHDVAFIHTPERFSAHGVRVMTAGLERCRSAAVVVCPSEVTRGDLVDLGFDPARLRVVPWGVRAEPVASDDVARVRSTYSLPDEFVLFVGTIEPRKNLARLAEAVSRSTLGLPLVVVGATGWGDQSGGPDARFLGFVPASDLGAIYTAARVFAYPSLQEGFGMPVIEAMAYGTPVVTSRDTSAAEVAGGAAVLVDPTSVRSIADGLVAAHHGADDFRAEGLARAATFSWERCAEAMAGVYRTAMEQAA